MISSSEPGFKSQTRRKRGARFDDNPGMASERRSGIGRRTRHLFGNAAAENLFELKYADKLSRQPPRRLNPRNQTETR